MAAPLPGAPAGKKPASSSPAAWLKSREGKITAGAAAVLVVVVLALRKGAGAAGGGTSADALQGGVDGTMQSQLDQLSGRGGSLDELTDTTTGLAGLVEDLRDLYEAQNPLPPTTPTTPKPGKPLASGARMVGGTVAVPWAIGKQMTMRDIAAQISKSKQPNAIESTLRGLVRLNPKLKGNSTVPRGTRVLVPDKRYYG